MNFTVYWRHHAQVWLATIWDQASDTEGLADAVDAVNRILRDTAHEQGESRDRATMRVWFHPPLCLHYQIDEIAKVVYVNAVKWIG